MGEHQPQFWWLQQGWPMKFILRKPPVTLKMFKTFLYVYCHENIVVTQQCWLVSNCHFYC
jgi:hypothetical protein